MPLINQIPDNWKTALDRWQATLDDCPVDAEWRNIIRRIDTFLQGERNVPHIYHPNPEENEEEDIFAAFRRVDFNDVKVIIIGQDPYPERENATGFAFSMPDNLEPSSSIIKIYNAIHADERIENRDNRPTHGNLEHWINRDVFLLNRILTFRERENNIRPNNRPRRGRKQNAHKGAGWEDFTEAVVKALSHDTSRRRHFMLWGVPAHKLYYDGNIINIPHHTVYKAAHPAAGCSRKPLLKDCGHFFAVNDALRIRGEPEIPWFPRPPVADG